MILKVSFYSICILLTALNLFQTWQATNGILHTTLTTKEYYWRVFLKTTATPEDRRWLEPEKHVEKNSVLPANTHFYIVFKDSLQFNPDNSMLNSNNLFSKPLTVSKNFPYDLTDHYLSVKATIDTAKTNTLINGAAHLVAIISKKGKQYEYRTADVTAADLKSKSNINLTLLIPPQCASKGYEIKTYLYIDNKSRLRLTSLSVEVLQKQ